MTENKVLKTPVREKGGVPRQEPGSTYFVPGMYVETNYVCRTLTNLPFFIKKFFQHIFRCARPNSTSSIAMAGKLRIMRSANILLESAIIFFREVDFFRLSKYFFSSADFCRKTPPFSRTGVLSKTQNRSDLLGS